MVSTHSKNGERRSHAVPGHEFSGVIAAVGEDTVGFAIGQEVYGMNDWFSDGALAEYCITQPTSVAQKPPSLTHVEAAAVPIGALTAWQGLLDRARLQAGERVLVHDGIPRRTNGIPLRAKESYTVVQSFCTPALVMAFLEGKSEYSREQSSRSARRKY